jgi:predicted ester cyclase
MSIDDNKQLVRDWVETVLNGRQFDRIPEFTSNTVFGERVQGALGALPDLTVEIVDLVAEGERIVLWGRGTATHEGPFRGIPPTGNVATMDLLAHYRIEDGRIADAMVIWDVIPLQAA